MADILWDEDITPDPALFEPGAQQVRIDGRQAVVSRFTSGRAERHDPACLVAFELPRGGGAVEVVDGRFHTDRCVVVRTLAAAIITRTP